MRHIDEIYVHCSDTRAGWMEAKPLSDKVAEIDRWHRNRGFSKIGYHFIIDRDGSIAEGRKLSEVGAHVSGHNKNSIGICLIGGYGGKKTDDFSKHFTDKQETALLSLLDNLLKDFSSAKVLGHNDVANKACPCFTVKDFLNERQTKNLQKRSGGNPASGSLDLGGLMGGILNALSRGSRK